MKRIIINADDFGVNEEVTSKIEQMILSGTITSTTVMANGACLDEVRKFTKEHPETSYGIHLCLSEFDSITKSENLYRAGLTDENGRFIHKAIFRLNNYDNPTIQSAIRDELNAQIDVVSELGFPISHADSHHHVHTIYPLREIFADVLKKRSIKKVRLGGDFRSWRMKAHLGLWIQRGKLNKFYRGNFITTDAFYGYAEFLHAGHPIKDGEVIELMCHPGHSGQQYQEEIVLVETKNVLTDNSIKIVSYNELY